MKAVQIDQIHKAMMNNIASALGTICPYFQNIAAPCTDVNKSSRRPDLNK